MRGIVACLKRQRFNHHGTSLHNICSAEKIICRNFLLKDGGLKHDNYVLTKYFHQKFFFTGYASVHGERPSAEYAKLRKESLESKFGHLLGTRSKNVSTIYHFGPFFALYRAAIISYHVLKLAIWRLFVHDMKKRSVKFRETLIRLGPFYIKLGQALSTRHDILPTVYCQELAKLQDQIPPFPTNIALRSIESELGVPVSQVFADITKEPIAAASLGQVYKAHLHSGELVAVKVQRPGMTHQLTLDALLFHMIGAQLKRFAKARKDLLVAVNEMVRHMFEEIDYILEGQNAERFASLYADNYNDETSSKGSAGTTIWRQKASHIKVPKIYWRYTRKAVLTMEWIDGIKLTNEDRLRKACLNRKDLIDQGLYCSLRQLLQVGFFHADPHPGNLVAMEDGSLAYFDFGMMGDIPRHYRVGLIRVLVHFVNRDSLGLASDFLSLGFIPEGVDIQSVSDALKASFGDGSRQSQDFQIVAISEQAAEADGLAPALDDKSGHPMGWKSFDMRAVVAATEDLFQFVLSDKGSRVRVFLVRDLVQAYDVFLQDEVFGCLCGNPQAKEQAPAQEHAMLVRVFNGLKSLRYAMKLAPDVWAAMFIRLAVKPEFQKFSFDVISAIITHSSNRIPDPIWVCLSRLLHKFTNNDSPKAS
ncbi:uncharacterized protein [Coffea arabica]|uniref:Uncharacterized protein isoform X2 n=1 Tax=Coffea arabica TaxID=13443 RepID=A0ABM4VF73_COFAR